jgi:hypothetical protein
MSLFQELADQYHLIHDKALTTNRFSYADFRQAVSKYEQGSKFDTQALGQSVEGRSIYSYTIGSGPKKVILWSQMHGNESTATRALLDVFQFFNQDKLFTQTGEQILAALTIKIIPMLNPDGAERFQRRNAQGIDINRDARALQAPESRILKKAIDEFTPDFAFNLHDQRRIYNIKDSSQSSVISFLAPAYDESESVNDIREEAMLMIAELNSLLQGTIAGGVGRYDDSYTTRAFGDNVQCWGISTVLVESGWLADDMEKEQVRKLNFLLLLSAFESLSTNHYRGFTLADYEGIPMNDDKMFDLLIKCAFRTVNGFKGMIDIGVNRAEISIPGTKSYYSQGVVEDIGDLSAYHGFTTIDEDGLCLRPGKIHEQSINRVEDLDSLDIGALLKDGILFIRVKDMPEQVNLEQPINLVNKTFPDKDAMVKFEGPANFLLTTQDGETKYIILNGFLLEPDNIPAHVNGIVLK